MTNNTSITTHLPGQTRTEVRNRTLPADALKLENTAVFSLLL